MFLQLVSFVFLSSVLAAFQHPLRRYKNMGSKNHYRCQDMACYPELLSRLYQGDIVLAQNAKGRNAIRAQSFLWPGGIVPYALSDEFDDEQKENIKNAMKGIESKTCVKFIPKTTLDPSYVNIDNVSGRGCHTMIGYRSNFGPMAANLEMPICRHQGTIQHELLHMLGLLHEQARPDRDEYVTILWENIDPEFQSDFQKAPNAFVTTYNVSYDYGSVMHYPNIAFSKNGKSTIIAKDDPDLELGQRNGASPQDLEKIRIMYNCTRGRRKG